MEDLEALKAAALSDTHRTGDADVIAELPRFVRLVEGMIARKCPNAEQDATTTLDDTDRSGVTSDLYTLPDGLLEVRRVELATVDAEGYPLDPVGPNRIALTHRTQRPVFWAVLGNRLQIRGVPGEGSEFSVLYFGRLSALVDDDDTNAILQAQEALYLHALNHHIYRFAEDLELAAQELGYWEDAADALNEATRRKLGAAGAGQAYDFGGGGGY